MKTTITLLSSLLAISIASHASANTDQFSVAALTPSQDIQSISVKVHVRTDCTSGGCSTTNETNEGLPKKYITQFLPALSYKQLSNDHDNTIEFGYYDLNTNKSIFPQSCLIHINSFAANSAQVSMSKNGCKIS